MGNYVELFNKVIKELAGEEIKKINSWRKEFTKEFKSGEINSLKSISAKIDKLWDEHTKLQAELRERTTDYFHIWGQKNGKEHKNLSGTRWKDKVLEQELHSKQIRNSSPYRRLKLAMDYWCSLWFWPIDQADLLPSRAEYLMELETILGGSPVEVSAGQYEQLRLFSETMSDVNKEKLKNLGYADVNKLCAEVPRFKLVKDLAEKHRFLHWELEFADIFNSNGGFDLVLGNPPWIRLSWNEKNVISDFLPDLIIHKQTSSAVVKSRDKLLRSDEIRNAYCSEYLSMSSMQTFINSKSNFYLEDIQGNLYKYFFLIADRIMSKQGLSAFIHDKGIYDESSGELREYLYRRLIYFFQFRNELKLFSEVGNAKKFELSIFRHSLQTVIDFKAVFELFHPCTIDESFSTYKTSDVAPPKANGKWNIQGHQNRVIKIDSDLLDLFAEIFDEDSSSHKARLLSLYSIELVNILMKMKLSHGRFRDYHDQYRTCFMFHETDAQSQDHIKKGVSFCEDISDFVLSGPHFYVATPYLKQPRNNCKSKGDYEVIDFNFLPSDFIQRSIYQCTTKGRQFIEKAFGQKVTDYFRLARRAMAAASNERTLITAIISPQVVHTNGVISIVSPDLHDLVKMAGYTHSIVLDFLVRIIGKTNIYDDVIKLLPLPKSNMISLDSRVLRLNCMTSYYDKIWNSLYCKDISRDSFTKSEKRLPKWDKLEMNWNENVPFRSSYERRQALLEIDVIVAMNLTLTLSELLSLYKTQFPVFKQYEEDTWYDQKGQIVFTCNKGLPGIGFSRPEWEKIKDMKEGTVSRTITDDTLPGGPVERTIEYHAPFDRCDREKDYEIAWKEFERRFQEAK